MKLNLNNIYLVLICLSLILLLFLRDIISLDISKYVFLLIIILGLLFLNKVNFISLICLIIPLMPGLPGSYIFIIALMLYVVKFYNTININKTIIPILAIIIIEATSVFYGLFSFKDYISFVSAFLFISIIMFNNQNFINPKKMIYSFIIGTFISTMFIVIQSIKIDGLNRLVSLGIRFGNTSELVGSSEMRLSYNPNLLGALCAMVISIILALLSKKKKYIAILLMMFFLIVGFFTYSRTYIVLLMLIIIYQYVISAKSIKSFLKNSSFLIIILISTYFVIKILFPQIIITILDRLSVEDITGGRIKILLNYNKAFFSLPTRILLGSGIQNYRLKYGLPYSSHNSIQEILITWGIVGLLFVISYFYILLRNVGKKLNIMYLLPLFVVLVSSLAGQFFTSYRFYFLLPSYIMLTMSEQIGDMQ